MQHLDKHGLIYIQAVTGSGKTLAFLIPTVERILRLDEVVKKHHVAAIIVSPTRFAHSLTFLSCSR